MLLDTSGLLGYLDPTEPIHQEACRLMIAAPRRLTHSYVLAELVALAHVRGLPRRPVLEFLEGVMDGVPVDVVYVDEELHRAAVELLSRRLDKTYSLCDAVSFVLMERWGLREALTTDHHFEQAGFVRLLRPS
jgi:predicted nucleic acid-binding protein